MSRVAPSPCTSTTAGCGPFPSGSVSHAAHRISRTRKSIRSVGIVVGTCASSIGTVYVSATLLYVRCTCQGVRKMRARFTTDEIAAAALGIVDAQGLSALSMRSLAAALGTGPMTLYNYVPDTAGLEELVVAAVRAQPRLPAPTGGARHDAQ